MREIQRIILLQTTEILRSYGFVEGESYFAYIERPTPQSQVKTTQATLVGNRIIGSANHPLEPSDWKFAPTSPNTPLPPTLSGTPQKSDLLSQARGLPSTRLAKAFSEEELIQLLREVAPQIDPMGLTSLELAVHITENF